MRVPGRRAQAVARGDYRLTVTGRREISLHYLRLSFDAGGLLTDRPVHPTIWIRMWFADGDTLPGHRSGVRRRRLFGWVVCDNRTTRAVAKVFREEYKIPRKSIKAQAYWVS